MTTTMNTYEATTTTTTNPRQTGTVVKWLNHKGIGFIAPDGQESAVGQDLLVHYSQIKQGGRGVKSSSTEQKDNKDENTTFKSLARGQKVEFNSAVDPKHPDKMIAVNVTGVGGEDCIPDAYRHRGRRGPPRKGRVAGDRRPVDGDM